MKIFFYQIDCGLYPSLLLLTQNFHGDGFHHIFYVNKIGILATGTSSSMKNISQEQLSNLPQVLPPLSEQQAIAAYLDTRCAEIDSLIAEKEAYKKSLIFECVTDKRRVA